LVAIKPRKGNMLGKIVIIILLIFFGFSMVFACPCEKKVDCGDNCNKTMIKDSVYVPPVPGAVNLNLPSIFGKDLMISGEITMPLSGQFELSYRTLLFGSGLGADIDYRGAGLEGWVGGGLDMPGLFGAYARVDANWHSEVNLGVSAQFTRPVGDFNFVTDHWPVYAMARCGWMNKRGFFVGVGVSFGYIIKNYNN